MEQALALLEVRDNIFCYLDPFDLASCALVCKEWNSSSIPWLYRTIGLQQGLNLFHSFERLRQKGHWVRHLIINQKIRDMDMFDSCTKLQTLKIGLISAETRLEAGYCQLVEQNRSTLQVFALDQSLRDVELTLQQLCLKVVECPKLVRLDLTNVFLASSQRFLEGFLGLSRQLKWLDLTNCTFPTDPQWLGPDMVFYNLTHLTVLFGHNTPIVERFAEFACRCPNLLALEWSAVSEAEIVPVVTHRILPSCPRLQVLRLCTERWDSSLRNQLIEVFLHPSRKVKWVDIQPSQQRGRAEVERFFNRVQESGVFETLEAVQLQQHVISSSMAQSILCLCPRLKAFQAEKIRTEDIDKDIPWVCHQLEYLKVHFLYTISHDPGNPLVITTRVHNSQDISVASRFKAYRHPWNHPSNLTDSPLYEVYRRLSELRQLRVLDTAMDRRGPVFTKPVNNGISFRLEQGLGLLEGLKRLEWIEFSGMHPRPSGSDILFMIDAWPHLRRFTPLYDEPSGEIRRQISLAMKKRGPIVNHACLSAYDYMKSTYL